LLLLQNQEIKNHALFRLACISFGFVTDTAEQSTSTLPHLTLCLINPSNNRKERTNKPLFISRHHP
jgi:hypothetical protein